MKFSCKLSVRGQGIHLVSQIYHDYLLLEIQNSCQIKHGRSSQTLKIYNFMHFWRLCRTFTLSLGVYGVLKDMHLISKQYNAKSAQYLMAANLKMATLTRFGFH